MSEWLLTDDQLSRGFPSPLMGQGCADEAMAVEAALEVRRRIAKAQAKKLVEWFKLHRGDGILVDEWQALGKEVGSDD